MDPVRWLADLVPKITHPITLIAFAVFVVVFLLNKLIVASGLLRQVGQKQSFRILNRILNSAAIALVLIILLAFAAYIYTVRAQASFRSKDVRTARRHLSHLADAVAIIKSNPKSMTVADELRAVVEPIYETGQILDPDLAIGEIEHQRELYGLDVITPALLAVSPATLEELLGQPFKYMPKVFRPTGHYSPVQESWSIDTYSRSSGLIELEYLTQLQRRPAFPFKDVVYFLAGVHPESWDQQYSGSLVEDAAYYMPIRRALFEGEFTEAAAHAQRFVEKYPTHRHADDAYVLKVIAQQGMGDIPAALATIRTAIATTDDDMLPWFGREKLRMLEAYLSADQAQATESTDEFKHHWPVVKYTRAHHLIAVQRYSEGIDLLESLSRDPGALCKEDGSSAFESEADPEAEPTDEGFTCIAGYRARADLAHAKRLAELWKDETPAGRYRYGLAVYDDELVHYNKVLGRGRAEWPRVPESYFRGHNNYYIAAHVFEQIGKAHSATLDLRQRALYKLGRCFDHLARSSAFFHDELDGKDRRDFSKLAVEAFIGSAEVWPEGPLADDALTEAAVHRYRLLGDPHGAIRLLEKANQRYPGRNAEDEATLWLSRTTEAAGQKERAEQSWKRLAEIARSPRVKEIVQNRNDEALEKSER